MIRIGTPPDIENYIGVNDDLAKQLHLLGFYPRWRDGEFIYFVATTELRKYLGGEE